MTSGEPLSRTRGIRGPSPAPPSSECASAYGPTAGAVFKDAALREQRAAETAWTGYALQPRLKCCMHLRILACGRGDLTLQLLPTRWPSE